MTPDAATLFLTAALRQVDNGYCSTHITADQLAELATCYRCKAARLEDAERRLEEIAALCQRQGHEWADHNRAGVNRSRVEIEALASSDNLHT